MRAIRNATHATSRSGRGMRVKTDAQHRLISAAVFLWRGADVSRGTNHSLTPCGLSVKAAQLCGVETCLNQSRSTALSDKRDQRPWVLELLAKHDRRPPEPRQLTVSKRAAVFVDARTSAAHCSARRCVILYCRMEITNVKVVDHKQNGW